MLPHTRARCDISSRRVPVDVRNTVMIRRVHKHQVRCKILELLGPLALKVHVEELELEALLRVHRRDNDESSSRRPVDGIAVLLVVRADVLEVADASALNLLRAVERHGRLWRDGRGGNGFRGSDDDEAVSLGLPREVDNGVLDSLDDLDRNALLLDAEDLQGGGQ
jgi:hypothetical protein